VSHVELDRQNVALAWRGEHRGGRGQASPVEEATEVIGLDAGIGVEP